MVEKPERTRNFCNDSDGAAPSPEGELRAAAYERLHTLEAAAWIYLTLKERGLYYILDEWRGLDESETSQEEASAVLAAIAPLLLAARPTPEPDTRTTRQGEGA